MSLAVNADTRLSTALELHDNVLEYVIALNPRELSELRDPKKRPAHLPLREVAERAGVEVGKLLLGLHEAAGLHLSPEERAMLETADAPQSIAAGAAARPGWTRETPGLVVDLLDEESAAASDPVRLITLAVQGARPGVVLLIKHRHDQERFREIWDEAGVEHHDVEAGPGVWWVFVRKAP